MAKSIANIVARSCWSQVLRVYYSEQGRGKLLGIAVVR